MEEIFAICLILSICMTMPIMYITERENKNSLNVGHIIFMLMFLPSTLVVSVLKLLVCGISFIYNRTSGFFEYRPFRDKE